MLLQEAPQVMVCAKTFKALRTVANATGAGASGHGQLHLSQNSERHWGPLATGILFFRDCAPANAGHANM